MKDGPFTFRPIPEQLRGEQKTWETKQTGEAQYEMIQRGDHVFHVVFGEHFSQKAADLLKDEIVPQIKDPSSWLFLIEGVETEGGGVEVATAFEAAKRKQIPLEDPVLNMLQPGIAKRFLASESGQRIPYAVIVREVYNFLQKRLGVIKPRVFKESYPTKPGELPAFLRKAKDIERRQPEQYKTQAEDFWQGAREASNAISAQVLDYCLRKHPDRKHVMLCIGEGHKPMIDVNISNLPEEFKVNDEQIETMLKERIR